MTNNCFPHIIDSDTVKEALEYGDLNVDDICIETSDNEGGFTLKGLRCVKCNGNVDIEFCQHPEDKKYVEILEEIMYEDSVI